MRVSRCLQETKPYVFVELNRRRMELMAQGVDVISLAVGDPDMPTPAFIVDALYEALRDPGIHHYPPYAGLPQFRAAAAAYLSRRFGLAIDPETELLALCGSKEGIVHLGVAFLDEGDFALVPGIGYPAYAAAATMRNARTWKMPMREGNGYLADFAAVPSDILARAKLMYLGYPNNPTGAIAPESYLDEAIAFCKEHDLLLAFDNAYCDICFDEYRVPSILSRPGAREVAIEFFSLSKGYNMAGWRIAFAAGNAQAVRALATVKSNTDSGVFAAIQRAGAVALASGRDSVQAQCAIYRRRRDMMVPALREMGLECAMPQAAIYLWARVPDGQSAASFSDFLLEQAHVAVAPGSAYGADGEGFVRISLTAPDERLQEALRRMRHALAGCGAAIQAPARP